MDAPAIVQSPDGTRIAAAWMDWRHGSQDPDVFLSIATGGRFAREAPITAQTGGPQNHPTLAWEAKTGAMYAVWEDGRRGNKAIRGCAVAKAAIEWDVSSDDEGSCSFPVVAAGGGVVVVAYESGDEVHLRVLSGP